MYVYELIRALAYCDPYATIETNDDFADIPEFDIFKHIVVIRLWDILEEERERGYQKCLADQKRELRQKNRSARHSG